MGKREKKKKRKAEKARRAEARAAPAGAVARAMAPSAVPDAGDAAPAEASSPVQQLAPHAAPEAPSTTQQRDAAARRARALPIVESEALAPGFTEALIGVLRAELPGLVRSIVREELERLMSEAPRPDLAAHADFTTPGAPRQTFDPDQPFTGARVVPLEATLEGDLHMNGGPPVRGPAPPQAGAPPTSRHANFAPGVALEGLMRDGQHANLAPPRSERLGSGELHANVPGHADFVGPPHRWVGLEQDAVAPVERFELEPGVEVTLPSGAPGPFVVGDVVIERGGK